MPFLIAFGAAALLTPISLRLGGALGIVDRPPAGDHLKIHPRPVPVTGGLAVVVAALGVGAAFGTVSGWVVTAVALMLAVGLVDDLHPIPPAIRLVAQAAGGALLTAGGARFGPVESLAVVGVILLALACTNAVNMMDGQDGLAGGLSAIAALGLAAVAALDQRSPVLALALAGSLGGFLVWNRPPARIFLGNGGAYAVGSLFALLAADAARVSVPDLLVAGACLAPFAFELVFSVSRRAWAKLPLSAGDRLHSYDLLAARVGGRARSTLVWLIAGAIAASIGVAIAAAPTAVGLAVTFAGLSIATFAGIRLWRQISRTATGRG